MGAHRVILHTTRHPRGNRPARFTFRGECQGCDWSTDELPTAGMVWGAAADHEELHQPA